MVLELLEGYGTDTIVTSLSAEFNIYYVMPAHDVEEMLSGPKLTLTHLEARLKWAKDYSHWRTRWRRVFFLMK